MKNKNFILVTSILIIALLFSIAYLPVVTKAAIVWSDNFNDGDCDGWTVQRGTWTCSEGYLECTENDVYSYICHESNTLKGTWSFDCYPVLMGINFMLMSEGTEVNELDAKTFGLILRIVENRIEIYRGGFPGDSLTSYTSDTYFNNTWTHINVTVDEDATINVFVNNIHRIHYDTLSFNYENIHFKFVCYDVGAAIDSIVVHDTIDYESLPFPTEYIPTTEITTTTEPETTTTTTTEETTTDTTTTPGIPIEWLAIGIGVPVLLVIVIVILKVRK